MKLIAPSLLIHWYRPLCNHMFRVFSPDLTSRDLRLKPGKIDPFEGTPDILNALEGDTWVSARPAELKSILDTPSAP